MSLCVDLHWCMEVSVLEEILIPILGEEHPNDMCSSKMKNVHVLKLQFAICLINIELEMD